MLWVVLLRPVLLDTTGGGRAFTAPVRASIQLKIFAINCIFSVVKSSGFVVFRCKIMFWVLVYVMRLLLFGSVLQ